MRCRWALETLSRHSARLAPAGVDAIPEASRIEGLNEDIVQGGFFVFGHEVADEEHAHELVHQRLANDFFRVDLYEAVEDGWPADGPPATAAPENQVLEDAARRVISRNQSPDVPFDQSINPYRGCEHGCIYCYARPTHAWLDLSPGLDFETKLFYKAGAASLLTRELA